MIATWDVESPKERVTDLEKAIRDWLDDETQRDFVRLSGFDLGAAVRTKRGPKQKRTTDEELMDVVFVVLERQERGAAHPTDLHDVAPFYLSDGRTRQLMAKAERRKLVLIERRDGLPNRYLRVDKDPAEAKTESRACTLDGDALRAARFSLNRKRRELEPDPARRRRLPP